MKISGCVIVKNESENIKQWLSAMQEIAHEMIVVDTGSTDDTKALAKAAGAKVFDYTWHNDFAAAKNYAIEQATGDWIMFLDADEYFDASSRKVLQRVMEKHHRRKRDAVILCQLINIDKDHNNKVIDTMLQARVFRNDPSIRFVGEIHEGLRNSGGEKDMVYDKDLTILHTGYSASIMEAKAKRNLAILQERAKHVQTDYEKGLLAIHMMDVYNSLREFDKAIEYAYEAIKYDVKQVGKDGHNYEILISAMDAAGYPRNQIIDKLNEAIDKYPNEEVFILEKGIYLWLDKNYLMALPILLQGMEMRKEVEVRLAKGDTLKSDGSLRVMHNACGALGDIYYHKGDKAKATEYYLLGLQYNKYHGMLIRGLYKCLMDAAAADVIQLLNKFFTRERDGGFILSTLIGLASPAIVAYYARDNADIVEAELYLKTNNYLAASVEASKNIHLTSTILTAEIIDAASNGRLESWVQPQLGNIRKILPVQYQQVVFPDKGYIKDDTIQRAVFRLLGKHGLKKAGFEQ